MKIYLRGRDSVTVMNALFSNRVINMKVNLQGNDSVTVMNAYTPKSGADGKKKRNNYMMTWKSKG